MSRSKTSSVPSIMYYSKGVWCDQDEGRDRRQKQEDRDENINGRRGTLRNARPPNAALDNDQAQSGPSNKSVSVFLTLLN